MIRDTLKMAAFAVAAALVAWAPAADATLPVPLAMATSEDMDLGRAALDRRAYAEAAEAFGRAIATGVAEAAQAAAVAGAAGATQAQMREMEARQAAVAAALYWQAYALNKDRRYADALVNLESLRADFDDTRWFNDARVLEREIQEALRGRDRVGRDQERAEREMERAQREREHTERDYQYRYERNYEYESSDSGDNMVVYALHGLMSADPDRAIPVLERFIAGDHPSHQKQQALFVLSQTDDDRALGIIDRIARDSSDPDLQLQAIQMYMVMGESGPNIEALYQDAADPRIKRALLEVAMANGHNELLMRVARDGSADTGVRTQAIQMLGVNGETDSLRTMYDSGMPIELRRAMLDAFGIAGDPDPVLNILRTETDPAMRGQALRSLGIMGEDASGVVLEIYPGLTTQSEKRAAVEALMMQDAGDGLRELYRTEQDPVIKRHIIQMLAAVGDDDSVDLFLEILDGTDQ